MPAWKKWVIGAGIVLALGLVGGAMQAAGITPDPQGEPQPDPTPRATHNAPAPQAEGTPTNGAPREGAYLEAVYRDARANGSGIHGYGDEKVLNLGYGVCDDLANGMAPTDVVKSLKGTSHAVSAIAPQIVGHAQTYLCQ
ncbi:hypothetical protein GCM10009834_24940 [Streptomonospora arabica]